jgi:hypothetical protein
VDQPLAEVGGEPTTFDFTDELDGPLPGAWEYYVLETTSGGDVTWSPEPDPPTFFRIEGGFAGWGYRRAPTLPGVGVAFSERGYAASPRNLLEGRNARACIIARSPLDLMPDIDADEFVYRVGIALQLDTTSGSWVGAEMRAVRQGATFTEEMVLELHQATGAAPVVVATASLPADVYPLDIWRNQDNAELSVELVDGLLTARLNGVVEVSAQVIAEGPAQVAFFAAVYERRGAFITPRLPVVGVQALSLRDGARLGPPPQVPGAPHLESPSFPMLNFPIRGLLDAKLIKQVSGRQFEFMEDAEVTVQHQTFRFDAGEVVRIQQRYTSQELVPAIRDLHVERSRKKGNQWR